MAIAMDVVRDPPESLRDAIEDPLIAYNDVAHGPHGYAPFAVMLREEATGAYVGGLWGECVFDWMKVSLLAVPEAHRRAGWGRRLMAAAEAFAREQHAAGIWLDTYNFQARFFYEKLGFTCFGELPGHPRGGTRFFMQKRLEANSPGDTIDRTSSS